MSAELITNIANISLALSVLVAVILGIVQYRIAARERRESLTMEAVRSFSSREFAELIYFINNAAIPTSYQEFMAVSAEDQIKFVQLSQTMESLGMMVYERMINVDLVDKTLGSYVVTVWEKYKTVFLDIREKTSDPFLGEYFQWLAETIDERMKKNPRKPFYVNRHKRQDMRHKT